MLRWVAFYAGLAFAGCSSSGDAPTGFQTAVSIATREDTTVTSRFEALTSAPRPILQVGLIDVGTSGNMLLEARIGPYEHYLSPNAASVTIDDGILHSMFGFGEGLMGVEVRRVKSLILRGQSGTADRTHTYLDGDDRQVFRSYRCTITAGEPETIQMPHRNANTQVMRENCRNADQAFENLYWVEQGLGQIVQSRQWAGPNLGAVSTRRAGLSQ